MYIPESIICNSQKKIVNVCMHLKIEKKKCSKTPTEMFTEVITE